jgi:hypothetical protein
LSDTEIQLITQNSLAYDSANVKSYWCLSVLPQREGKVRQRQSVNPGSVSVPALLKKK